MQSSEGNNVNSRLFTLGGNVTVQRKHQSVSSSHYNSGFFITSNDYPDFGPGRDAEAIKKRLSVFETSTLPRKDTSISGKCAWNS